MPTTGASWGSGSWGYGAWGGGGGGALIASQVSAYRENVFRVEFTVPVYWSAILDPNDSSIVQKWSVAVVAGTTGLDGNPTRPINIVEVYLPGLEDGVAQEDIGRFVDLVTDRPMSSYPSQYEVTMTNIFARDLMSDIASETQRVPGVFKQIQPPVIQFPNQSRDLANPQVRSAMDESLPNPNDPLNLGIIPTDDTHDYAFDEGNVNLQKRVIRRIFTKKNGFAHLPNYGVGLPYYGKKLAVSAVIASIAADAETQIALEPDVSKVKVRPIIDQNTPGLLRLQIVVKPRDGQTQRFDIPFNST